MFYGLVNYFHERRPRLRRMAGYLGGAYLLGSYVLERFEDVRTQVTQDRLAKDNLRKRFEQNQQDISYTIMALLPTLGKHVLEGMDVEGVTAELQSMSKPSRSPKPASPPETSLASSVELTSPVVADELSENGSVSIISSVHENGTSLHTPDSSMSWVDQLSMQSSQEPGAIAAAASMSESPADVESSKLNGSLSESMLSTSSTSSKLENGHGNSPPESISSEIISTITRSKAELWKEVKILTFTRTLTALYSITLLSLFTHIQLSLLGRSKYIQSVKQMERDERIREQLHYASTDFSHLWSSGDLPSADELDERESLSEETEHKFLTLSWWILHVGWKDVGERVRRGVEDVFEEVSLKSKLTINDLFRLVSDVRRRIEYEVTFEGHERRINFVSALLPPTTETLQHVLTQGGIPPHIAGAPDLQFHALLEEARTHILSASGQRVLEVCLDEATETLFSALQRQVFNSGAARYGVDTDDVEQPRERLAAMLPGLARWCHRAFDALPNELVDGLGNLRDMEAFSAIVFSSYDDHFR
ncbi:hypothetical protein POSPLADRAFT_1062339 [Postia placenta MAD-698-R-SB12]|uniref:Peroxin-3 n=1 Tax=Postia placenta MAD-698-R-SB12 TaxID=670580 RepID=A0A1X6MK51_9APHY|nr:hypothetical protein POSPLADRAFT_1062339 [Postia placenta MAD-698-R-SB12]OSX56831.1 hypothetical protein POSPLADRAFT_1062339 [Postia placenta MAD-698-R-SB12]